MSFITAKQVLVIGSSRSWHESISESLESCRLHHTHDYRESAEKILLREFEAVFFGSLSCGREAELAILMSKQDSRFGIVYTNNPNVAKILGNVAENVKPLKV